MEKLRLRQVAEATGGVLTAGDPETEIGEISKDSRQAGEAALFFALKGERYDAHMFLEDAAASGCRNFVISRPETVPNRAGLGVIRVEDTCEALQALARAYIRMFDVRKIGVTGSTGKTTTKDMLFRICREKFKTVKSEGNLNNHIGLPLSAFSIERDTEVAIFEMGMDKAGEINFLAEIVRPQIGVITNVGVSHIENFANREGILKAKMEITNYFSAEDALVVYSDNDMLSEGKTGGKYRLVRVGSGGRDDFVISGIEERGDKGSSFFLEHGADMEKFSLPMPGRHNVFNAAFAAAAASCLGVPISVAAKALSKPVLSDGRLRIKGKDGMKIIDDTYNASPDSMIAALDILASVHGVRRIAILGDMLELGAGSPGYHRQIGAYAADKRTDILIAVGDRAGDIAKGAKGNMPGARIFHYASKKAAMPRITELLTPGDVVLVKGSRAMAMEEIVKRILE